MTLTDEQTRDIVTLRLESAAQALADAETLLKAGSLRGAANRVYYGMFHAVSALAVQDGKSFKKHSGLITFFQKEYAKPEVLDRRHGRALQKAFDDRSEADYEDRTELTVEQVTERVREARDLLGVVRGYIARHAKE